MREITIYKRLFYHSDCYNQTAKQTPKGVQVHSTGANNPYLRRYVQPDDGRLGQNVYKNDSNRSGTNVCASAYIGKQKDGTPAIYEVLPWNYQCWLSGKGINGNANKLGYIGFEICEDDLNDRAYFEEVVLGLSVNLTAYLLTLANKTPESVVAKYKSGTAIAVMDHKELCSTGLASNHGDITHWLKRYGMDMDDYRELVRKAMEEGVHVTYIDCDSDNSSALPSKFEAIATPTGTYLNVRAGKGTNFTCLGKLVSGDIVDVLDDSDSMWWQIRCASGTIGYAMTGSNGNVWLKKKNDFAASSATWVVTIHGLSKSDADNLCASYSSATVCQENA